MYFIWVFDSAFVKKVHKAQLLTWVCALVVVFYMSVISFLFSSGVQPDFDNEQSHLLILKRMLTFRTKTGQKCCIRSAKLFLCFCYVRGVCLWFFVLWFFWYEMFSTALFL